MDALTFNSENLKQPPLTGMDVQTALSHFSIITYMVDPEALRRHIHERFELDCITAPDGSRKALISVVPFVDQDFHFYRSPWLKWNFVQTNYRAYVTDTETGEHVVWFFGTALDSVTVTVPRYIWKLPWHHTRIQFDTEYSHETGCYTHYRMKATGSWAPAELELKDSGVPPRHLSGFPDLESGLVLLTHPLRGYFYRNDQTLGSYAIWHDRLQMTEGQAMIARWPLLDQLDLIEEGSLAEIHSVLIQPITEFTIYLPPKVVK